MKSIERNYTICTLDRHLDCSACELAEKIDCSRFNRKQMRKYYRVLMVMLIPSFLVLILASFQFAMWYLVPAYLVFWFLYQLVAELFIRCRHCPFWDEANPKLDCRINCGVPKLNWLKPKSFIRFKPSPLSFWEKFVIQAFSYVQFFIPFFFSVAIIIDESKQHGRFSFLSVMYVILALVLTIGGIYFLRYLLGKLCPNCLHFSCPNNKQPYAVIKAYLDKNKIMHDAWENDLHKYEKRK